MRLRLDWVSCAWAHMWTKWMVLKTYLYLTLCPAPNNALERARDG